MVSVSFASCATAPQRRRPRLFRTLELGILRVHSEAFRRIFSTETMSSVALRREEFAHSGGGCGGRRNFFCASPGDAKAALPRAASPPRPVEPPHLLVLKDSDILEGCCELVSMSTVARCHTVHSSDVAAAGRGRPSAGNCRQVLEIHKAVRRSQHHFAMLDKFGSFLSRWHSMPLSM